jgi:hypothetical protein
VVVVKKVDDGTFVNGNILVLIRRFHPKQEFPADSLVVSRDGNQQAWTGGAQDLSSV